jgi:hypothetical protein
LCHHRETLVRRLSLQLDRQGWQEVAAVLEQTVASLQQIHAGSAHRAAEIQPRQDPDDAEVALALSLRRDRAATWYRGLVRGGSCLSQRLRGVDCSG